MRDRRMRGIGYLLAVAGVCLVGLPLAMGSTTGPDWLAKVPAKARAEKNPLAGKASAVKAGRTLYVQYCAMCHGQNAQGQATFPSLHTAEVRNLTGGDIQWLLTNGSLAKGMPAWTALSETQRWELVSYIRSLPPMK
ncbi:MAG: c-type cytochrome [Acidobacteriaceae bacterium]